MTQPQMLTSYTVGVDRLLVAIVAQLQALVDNPMIEFDSPTIEFDSPTSVRA
jgi:hypothetical protein